MTTNLINPDTICDLQGNPLHPDSVILLKAFDKLLTVGAYYSAKHNQYLEAAEKARNDIVGVIGGANKRFAIEITAQGVMLNQQTIDPRHRNVRLLHELLVPLNIARLDIRGTLTSGDLLRTIAALQEYKTTLGQSNSFHEIIFKNLPDSVQAISCSVLQKSEKPLESGKSDASLDDLLDIWNDDTPSTDDHNSGSDPEQLASQFTDMVSQILGNLEKLDRESGILARNAEDGSYVTRADLPKLKLALQQLVEMNPDLAELTKLLAQAQRALDLSQDEKSVNLVFRILKKDMVEKRLDKAVNKVQSSTPIEYKLTIDELLQAVAEMETADAPMDEPWACAQENQLVICLHLLRTNPTMALRASLIDTIEQVVGHRDFTTRHLHLFTRTFHGVVHEDGAAGLDDLLTLVTGILRQKRAEMIALFWEHLLALSDNRLLPKLWPHLVNDILLGFNGAPRETVIKLVLAAVELPLEVVKAYQPCLEKQPALQGQSATRDLFSAPLIKLYPICNMLMASPLGGWLGSELYRALRSNPGSPLIEVLIAALGKHHAKFVPFYLDLIRHHANPQPPRDIRQPAFEILKETLSGATPEVRQADWVPLGLTEMAKLDPPGASPLLKKVINGRKFLFFKTWPAPAREAAKSALTAHSWEVR